MFKLFQIEKTFKEVKLFIVPFSIGRFQNQLTLNTGKTRITDNVDFVDIIKS